MTETRAGSVRGAAADPTRIGAKRFSVKGALVLGRDPRADVHLDHPAVSRRHARIATGPDGVVADDLGSTNGVYVDGTRIRAPTVVRQGGALDIGLFSWTLRGTEFVPRAPAAPRVRARSLEKVVSVDGVDRRLLHSVSLDAREGEFTAILGPSGCGKSTLIRLLSGRSRPSAGGVSYSGRDLSTHFDLLKHTIAFVPQRETLPDDLVLEDALTFTARLRFPSDATGADRDEAIHAALRRVGLQRQRDQPIGALSGGQRKRAALANELLVQPTVLFLDEVTSGLDEATDAEMMALFAELAGQGVTVMCVTHTVANVADHCDRLIVLATGGYLAYHGPPADAPAWFGCRGLSQIYPALEGKEGKVWAARASAASGDLSARHGRDRATESAESPPDRRLPLSQLPVLLQRTLAVMIADPKGLAFTLGQALAVGLLFRLVFSGGRLGPTAELQFAFLLGVSSFWLGCSGGSKEIVKERALFELERDVNLRVPAYVVAKLMALTLIGAGQVILMHGVIAATGVQVSHVRELLVLHLFAVTVGAALGLLISSVSERDSQAATLVPLALIPQIMLSGAVVTDLSGIAETVAQLFVSVYWLYRIQTSLLGPQEPDLVLDVGVLGVHLAVFLLGSVLVLSDFGRARA
ncbi:MAG: ATP-binding cassette domain-containing protein [Longimicrobiales bacterium]|nr:ATP-binding cassette domain-containing protein [Longimicrobiales bacterium]